MRRSAPYLSSLLPHKKNYRQQDELPLTVYLGDMLYYPTSSDNHTY